MLPWRFVVLLLINAVVFNWGYQREVSREPVPPPVPEGGDSVRLVTEVAAEAEPRMGTAGSEAEQAAVVSVRGSVVPSHGFTYYFSRRRGLRLGMQDRRPAVPHHRFSLA